MVSYYETVKQVNNKLDGLFKKMDKGYETFPILIKNVIYELTLEHAISERYIRSRIRLMCEKDDKYMILEDRIIKVPSKKISMEDKAYSE